MITKFTKKEYESAKSNDYLSLECECCGGEFRKQKKEINRTLKGDKKTWNRFCSKKCMADIVNQERYGEENYNSGKYLWEEKKCDHCGGRFIRGQSEKKSKSGKYFCSKSCAATYNNTHKKHGTRRSKLEIWLEEQLSALYPDLNIDYNGKEAIGSELDIYIPSLKLAFELNGIFHYEPIYGKDKLDRIQENDQNKFQKCIDKEISLCVIDSSGLKYFKPKRAEKYLNIITEIIDKNFSDI